MCRQFGGENEDVSSGWFNVTISSDEPFDRKIPISRKYIVAIGETNVASIREILGMVSNALSS